MITVRKSVYLLLISIICSVIYLFFTPAALAQETDTGKLVAIKHQIQALNQLKADGLISDAQLEQGIQRYLAQATREVGRTITLKEILETPEPAAQKLTPLQEFAGFITFINVLWVLAIIVGVVGFAYLFSDLVKQLFQLLKNVPLIAYEIVFYAISLALLIGGWFTGEPVRSFMGFTGCLLFVAALAFTFSMQKLYIPKSISKEFLFSAITFVIWLIATIIYQNPLIGFITVIALFSTINFSLANDVSIERATLAAFVILMLFVGLRVAGTTIPILAIFEFGALIVGSIVGYCGLLINSSRWHIRDRRRYMLFQITTILAGVSALFIGSVFHIPELQRIGGTFFVIYIVGKLIEIPARNRRGYATLALSVSLVVSAFCWYVLTHQEMFQAFLFLPG